MERICPNCGKSLPEEASFCLYCFTDINNYKKSEVCPAVVATTENEVKKAPFIVAFKAKLNKKLFCRIGVAAAFLLLMGVCIFAMKSMNSGDNLKPENDTKIIKETSTVAVTNKGGEAVTDEAGEQVFEIVEVTKIAPVSTTEKQGFFDKIFGSSTTKDETKKANTNDSNKNSDSTETTKKQSFFDKLFGNDEKEEENTTENSSTTKNNDPSTEEFGTTQAPSTSEESTTTPTTTKPTQTETKTSEVFTTESGSYYFEYEPQYSSSPDGNIALTQYIGSAEIVTIPSYIDGRKVAVLKQDCFSNDSKIKEIRFDDSSTYIVSLYYHCFNNLTSLEKVIFNNKSFHISTAFAYNCPITYLGKDGKTDNKLIDGAYYSGSTFIWFTAHSSYTTLTFPDWCTKIDNAHNLNECNNLKIINIHKKVLNIPKSSIYYGDGLTSINVETGHPEVFSSEGVLFYKWGKDTIFSSVYPYCKTDKTFRLPANCYLSMGKGSIYTVNTYLEELWLPQTGYLKSPASKDFYNNCYPNLKKIYIAENHPQYEDIKKTFKGELIVKNF